MGHTPGFLEQAVSDKSSSKDWSAAVDEWSIHGLTVSSFSEQCLCGKEGITNLYTIYNETTDEQLSPIGSTCIMKFERDDLNSQLRVFAKLMVLRKAIASVDILDLFSSEYLSKASLKYMYDDGAFKDDLSAFSFFMTMFKRRDKDGITEIQHHNIRRLFVSYIIPYVEGSHRLN